MSSKSRRGPASVEVVVAEVVGAMRERSAWKWVLMMSFWESRGREGEE